MTQAPTPFTASTRHPSTNRYGSLEKFRALGDGYFGMNWVFAANLALAGGASVVLFSGSGLFIPFAIASALLMAMLVYPTISQIAFGKGWSKRVAVGASILMGINSIFFCGVVGYAIMQVIATAEMRQYGFKTGLGLTKQVFEDAFKEMLLARDSKIEVKRGPKW